jgi:eukaryotic-like serine/threonine-protein kinase
MPLATGTKLGSYEILGAIGAGGMGEVFRARDTKLQRDVALKILPSVFALDFDRLARFKREAHVLACLNHPNIAAIHGFEDSTDPQALALELVEGPTLADRIAKGPIPLDEVVPIARQICDALESAHEQGIVHRDLKPANIKVRADGTVKVLDFGLAKALEQTTAGGGDATASPTITSPALTRLGLILGTAAYMSPEQARGRAADKRSDIWAFGCVLYEMLTGKRTFDGEEISDTLASVLKSEPDWSALPAKLPAPIRSLVEGCLKRDRRDRIGNISTARFLLNQPLIPSKAADVIQTAPQPVWRRAVLVAVGVATGAAVVAGIWNLRPSTVSPVTRFEFALPHGQQLTLPRQAVAISPDGSHIAYSADGRLYLRSMAALEPLAIAGTENGVNPVFAPDGQSLVFWVDSSIKRIALTGGVPVTICRTGTAPSSISWSKEGILFPQPGAGIMRVSENGGEPEPLVPLSRPEGRAHGPQMLPDGNTVLFTSPKEASVGDDIWDRARIVVHSLTTGHRCPVRSQRSYRVRPQGDAVCGSLQPRQTRGRWRPSTCRRRRPPLDGGGEWLRTLRLLGLRIIGVSAWTGVDGGPGLVPVRPQGQLGGAEASAGDVQIPAGVTRRQASRRRIERRQGSVHLGLRPVRHEFTPAAHIRQQQPLPDLVCRRQACRVSIGSESEPGDILAANRWRTRGTVDKGRPGNLARARGVVAG